MKCKKCNYMNPEGAKYCGNCGNKLEEMKCCTNPNCDNHNRYVIPLEASFCPKCGKKIETNSDAPFHVRYPEYDLVPITDFRYKDYLLFIFNKPEYIEDRNLYEGFNYFFIAKNEKIGILRYEYIKHWYGDNHCYKIIIPCKYDKIERSGKDDFFICYNDDEKVYFDNNGKKLK